MHKTEFLTIFEKHLLVGEPKRGEIVAELNTHLEELSNRDPQALGEPKRLATKYNRTHLGFFHTERRLVLIPGATWLGLFCLTIIPDMIEGRTMSQGSVSSSSGTFWGIFLPFLALAPILVVLLRFIRTLAKLHHLARTMSRIAVSVGCAGFLFFVITILIASTDPESAINIAAAVTLALIGAIQPILYTMLVLLVGAAVCRRVISRRSQIKKI